MSFVIVVSHHSEPPCGPRAVASLIFYPVNSPMAILASGIHLIYHLLFSDSGIRESHLSFIIYHFHITYFFRA